MELLLSLWLNKVSKARPFADSPTSVRAFSEKSPLRSQLICDSREALCISEWGVVIVFVEENHKIQDKTQSIWIHHNVVTSFSSTLTLLHYKKHTRHRKIIVLLIFVVVVERFLHLFYGCCW